MTDSDVCSCTACTRSAVPEWISVSERLPEKRMSYGDPPPYVLAVDSKGRMSIAYCDNHSCGHIWVMAKQIGEVTYWQPLPSPPADEGADK